MSEIRTITNVCGNAVAMVVIAMWEDAFDRTKAGAILRRKPVFGNPAVGPVS